MGRIQCALVALILATLWTAAGQATWPGRRPAEMSAAPTPSVITFTPPPPAIPTSAEDARELWVAAGARGEYSAVVVRLVGSTASLRLWLQDSTGLAPSIMQAVAEEVEGALQAGLLGSLLAAAEANGASVLPIDVAFVELEVMAGYFTSMDQPAGADRPYSNAGNFIYVDTGACTGPDGCSPRLLRHELQHLLQHLVDPDEETWFNEGLSELAEGAPITTPQCTDLPLFRWSGYGGVQGQYYALAASFLDYWRAEFGEEALEKVALSPLPGTLSLRAWLSRQRPGLTLEQVHREWAVTVARARLAQGETTVSCPSPGMHTPAGGTIIEDQVAQWGFDVIALPDGFAGEVMWEAPAVASLLPALPPSGGTAWWAHNAHAAVSTLAATLDLRSARDPRLEYMVWYDIEEGYDWVYVEVSADGGLTWEVLPVEGTTRHNPYGTGTGPGYNGASDGWQTVTLDLAPYRSQSIRLRFRYATDDALEGTGLAVAGLQLTDEGTRVRLRWTPVGFSAVSPRLAPPQQAAVLALYHDGSVQSLPIAENGRATWRLASTAVRALLVWAGSDYALPMPYRLELRPVASDPGG